MLAAGAVFAVVTFAGVVDLHVGRVPDHGVESSATTSTLSATCPARYQSSSTTRISASLKYGEHQAEQWISSHDLVDTTAMLWTNLAWPLVDDELVPPTRSGPLYVTLALENGTTGILSRMNASPPELILVAPLPHREPGGRPVLHPRPCLPGVMDANGIELYVVQIGELRAGGRRVRRRHPRRRSM